MPLTMACQPCGMSASRLSALGARLERKQDGTVTELRGRRKVSEGPIPKSSYDENGRDDLGVWEQQRRAFFVWSR